MSGVDQSWMERWCDTWRSALRLAQKKRGAVYTTGCETRELQYVPVPKRQSASALPRNLKRLMDAHAWTVGRLSKASGVNRSTIRNALKADKAHNHTLDVILRLAEALGVGREELVKE